MPILNPSYSRRFEKEFVLMKKGGKNLDKFRELVHLLVNEITLPQRYRDHKLQGRFSGFRECHIEPDWLLIYKITENSIIFERMGTHSDLFE